MQRMARSLAVTLPAAVILAACGSSSGAQHAEHATAMGGMSMISTSTTTASPSSSAGQVFNNADVQFATQMIPHHEQAVTMAKLAATRASSTQVKQLAADIEKAQAPEIQQMSDWLQAWGKPVPTSMSGHDMGSAMPGMMSSQDMQKLMDSTGADFDRMFLTMMISHHEGALSMARTEIAQGQNPDAIALAHRIQSSQTAQIATMKTLLG